MSTSNSSKQAKARDLRHRVFTCLHKLSDRDTHSAAASELEYIARTISADSLPPFISSISATDTSDKSPVRRQCLRLITILSEHHRNFLSPHLSKLLSAIIRRLRDPDSSVRSACIAASLSLSSYLTSPTFSFITKPFLESLFTEQDPHAQSSAALCLAAIIEGSRSPEAGSLRRLLPRLEKLAKSHNFKAKAALLVLIGGVVGVNGMLTDCGDNVVRNLVACLTEFLSCEDWAARKAAAEALMKIAIIEKEALSEYKFSCLKIFEAKRFDKVKATRETMNQMVEAWKEIPDSPDDKVSPLPESEASSKENASDGRYPPGSKTFCSVGSRSTTPRVRKNNLIENPTARTLFANSSSSSAARKRSPPTASKSKTGRPIFQKLNQKKPLDLKVDQVSPHGSCGVMVCGDSPPSNDLDKRKQHEQAGIRRTLFNENNGKQKLGVLRSGSRVVPCCDNDVVINSEAGDICSSGREVEDLSLIRKQLLQIENQHANLIGMLQRFIGSSQNGMQSLEARVRGLELALDEISFDLAVSTGRISQNGTARVTCCRLPGTGLLSSMFWRREKEYAQPASQPFAPGQTPSATAFCSTNGAENRRFVHQCGRGIIANPLAKIYNAPPGFSEVSASGVANNGAV